MSDALVGQLQLLHDITAETLSAYEPRTVRVLGVAAATGLISSIPTQPVPCPGQDLLPAP